MNSIIDLNDKCVLTLTRYAIRHIPTGGYIPGRKTHGTWAEPLVMAKHPKETPRLLVSQAAAKLALNSWLLGKWTQDTEDGCTEVYQHLPHRKREEMEIIPITIEIPI